MGVLGSQKTNTTLATQRRRDEESGGDRRDTRAGASGVGPAGRGLGFVQGKILAVPDPTTSKFYVGLIPREDAEVSGLWFLSACSCGG